MCNGFYLSRFEEKVGATEEKARKLLLKFSNLIRNISFQEGHTTAQLSDAEFLDNLRGDKKGQWILEITIQEISITIAALREVCVELENWEFQTHMGHEREEVEKLIAELLRIYQKCKEEKTF